MDLLSVLPGFSTKSYAHILPPLERAHINVVDLITLDTLEIAKRAHVPPADVRRLSTSIVDALHQDVGFERPQPDLDGSDEAEPSSSIIPQPTLLGPATKIDLSQWNAISTLDPALDALLDGGIPTGYVTEVTGESGSGKTQFLLSLLLAVQLPSPQGLGKSAIYISTEAALATPRLSQILEHNPYLSSLPRDDASTPSLENVLSINAMDLETQEHILNYQLPVAIERYNVGLVVIDSITSNYRAELSSSGVSALSMRSGELAKLGQMLRNLAVRENLAVVVANQVSDRIEQEGFGYNSNFNSSSNPISRINTSGSGGTPGSQSPIPRNNRSESGLGAGNAELLSQHVPVIPTSSPAILPSSPYTEEEQQQQQSQQPFDGSYLVGNPVRNEILSLLHQQRFFTGWGDTPTPIFNTGFHKSSDKTPTLGFVWATQIACRIALKKEMPREEFADYTLPEISSSSLINHSHSYSQVSTEKHIENGTDASSVQQSTNQDEKAASNNEQTPQHNKPPEPVERAIKRTMKLVFAPWSAGSSSINGEERNGVRDEVVYRIWKGGLQGISDA